VPRSVHLVVPITKSIWFVLVPNEKKLNWFGVASQLPNAISFGLVPIGQICLACFGWAWLVNNQALFVLFW
jgi:hypothetical protein